MRLKKLLIHGYGPFALPTLLDVDENVTVLTGQNDVGKSAILRLIRLICKDIEPNEDDQNTERRYDANSPWNTDNEVSCIGTFVIDNSSGLYLNNPNLGAGDEVDIKFNITTKATSAQTVRRGSSQIGLGEIKILRMPTIIYLPSQEIISSSFEYETANSLEKYLVFLAFGENADAKLQLLREDNRSRDIENANRLLKRRLSELIPVSLGLELRLMMVSDFPLKFALHFEDKHTGFTTIRQRGTGIQKIVTLIVALARAFHTSEYCYVLFDEPENSLHADMQHKLRKFLETIGSLSNVQVIYATHSPSMINSVNVSGLRLMERTNKENRATSVIDNQPYKGNFVSVRSSLGLSPSDSLLYAPITIITEGVTEILGLPYLLERLYESKADGFETTKQLLSLVHFIDGEGTSFEYWCRLAKSQGAKPIIFVDGDKIRRVKQQDISSKHSDVPIIHLEAGNEFEDIVPKETYFIALAEVNKIDATYNQFIEWQNGAKLPKQIMFSKRVERWLQESFPDTTYYKQRVMRRALELVDLNEIKHDVFLQLVQEIYRLLHGET